MSIPSVSLLILFFFFNDTATTEIYTLSLHDALPISPQVPQTIRASVAAALKALVTLLYITPSTPSPTATLKAAKDRKSTRLNSSHQIISYAVFCLKKKN